MADNSKTILQKDINIEGNIYEKETIEINSKIKGNIKAENVEIEEQGLINGNINSTSSVLSGTINGDINSEKVHISSTATVEGNIKQKTLSIDEGAKLKINTQTSK